MPYQDTVFGGLMKAFPRWRFDKLAERHASGLPGSGAFRRGASSRRWCSPSCRARARCARRSVRWNAFRASTPIWVWRRCGGLRLRMPTGYVRRPCSRTYSRPWSPGWAHLRASAGGRCCASSTRRRVLVGQADRELGGRRRRQAARGLRPGRRCACLLCRDLGQGQRHHAGQAPPHRARRDLRLRQGLLRLHLLGRHRRQGEPLRPPA